MIKGLYTAASGMLSREIDINVVSNNLANLDTPGFKKDVTINRAFKELLVHRLNDNTINVKGSVYDYRPFVGKLGTGVGVDEIATIHEQGHLRETGGGLDFALEGDGFFAIETQGGEKYSRNGVFTLDGEGFLVTTNGDYVLSTSGRIQIEGNGKPIVSEDGRIWVGEGGERRELGQFRVVDFKDTKGLRKIGDSWFQSTPESGDPIDISARATVKSGFLEKSNVNVILEMVKMIQLSRIYEANSRAIRTHDDTLNRAINQVGRKA